MVRPDPRDQPERRFQRTRPVHARRVGIAGDPAAHEILECPDVPGLTFEVPGLSEVDEELVAVQFPDIFHVAVAQVSAVDGYVCVKQRRPPTTADGIALPVDLFGIVKRPAEELEVTRSGELCFLQRGLAFGGVLGRKQGSHLLGRGDTGEEPLAMLLAGSQETGLPARPGDTAGQRSLKPANRRQPSGGVCTTLGEKTRLVTHTMRDLVG